ncbi:MAG: ribonuclease HI, partial [Flavobacteriales bacterium]|jgi:ribonuclease HI|nr:ribonuclease HI [Crocinitomicaceae bacterium]MEE2837239.1 ribonuclease HI [Bacteroidota bacterium]HAI01542.1 ribonuclease HI [Flavobacteriales bacterium]|tara:strand:+ start:22 stop:483 length:462 start_codon:yes stop_codon:yes gene_type:complete
MAKVTMYTDGGASGNPGPGGYGTLLMYGEHVKEMSEGFRLTTNNRMELLAVIVGLEALTRDGIEVDVYSDSKYVVDAVEKRWVFGWEKKGYKDKKNPDLWQRFLRVYRRHQVRFHWVKGHAGNPLNERVDAMAVAAYQTGDLLTDAWYEAHVG